MAKAPGDIRDELLSWCNDREEEVCNMAKDYFKQEHLDFNAWYLRTSNVNKAVDETALFLLCKQYSRHVILVNRVDYWSTLNPVSKISEFDACASCDLGLLHLGYQKYALIENKPGYSIHDTVNKIREFFKKCQANAKRKLEREKKLSECVVHQNRSKRQKRDVNYLELNIGKCLPQPKSKFKKPKKIDIVAALCKPSENRLPAYQIQKERQLINPGDVIGTIIKTEIKCEVKVELDRINTRHKYKNIKIPENANYIHADGTPCHRARQRANELPDLPRVDTQLPDSNLNGLPVETALIEASLENNSTVTTAASTNRTVEGDLPVDGDLPVETGTNEKHVKQTTENESVPQPGLTVETDTIQTDNEPAPKPQSNLTNELIVEMENKNKLTAQTIASQQNETIESHEETPSLAHPNRTESMLNETNKVNTGDRDDSTVSEAPLGLMMLNNSTENDLLQKYHNSMLLPVDASKREDHGKKPTLEVNGAVSDVDDGYNYDSDDTIILQHEIEDTIGVTLSKPPTANLSAPVNTNKDGLPVETQSTNPNLDTTAITRELSNLTVTNSPTRVTHAIPVSLNRGTVVFKSYRLCRRTTDSDKTTGEVTSRKQTTENDIQLAKIPSGNSTRPPPPDKYKIKKIQIDKVCYYSCLHCNKHFESLQYLNKHHRQNHPPVSCDVCSRTYDTPNSLIRHSYTHLSGNHQCNQCQESFHFKSKLESHKNIHSNRRFQCNKCDRSFIRNSDLNAHLDTHGKKWKCSFKGCTKECADKRYLSTHMKTHSNELKYQCRMCNSRFHFYEQRKRHENNHP